MKNNKIIIPFLLLLFFTGYFFLSNENKNIDLPVEKKIGSVRMGGIELKVDLASTFKEREKGLSGRNSLSESSGMLFIFDISGDYTFWMKDMNFPIDIIWINENLQIVFIEKNVKPDTYPLTFKSPIASKYVLEVTSGISTKNNFKVGDKVEFLP